MYQEMFAGCRRYVNNKTEEHEMLLEKRLYRPVTILEMTDHSAITRKVILLFDAYCLCQNSKATK